MMNEKAFWQIIDSLNWQKDKDDDIVAPVVTALSHLPDEDIFQFDDLLAEKLYALDGERFARHIGEGSYTDSEDDGGYFSVDNFLYARCCVVASGQEFYEAVLHNPVEMPKDATFESLLYLPQEAWTMKHGEDSQYPHFHEVWYETFSNPEGWPGITPLKNRILGTNEATR